MTDLDFSEYATKGVDPYSRYAREFSDQKSSPNQIKDANFLADKEMLKDSEEILTDTKETLTDTKEIDTKGIDTKEIDMKEINTMEMSTDSETLNEMIPSQDADTISSLSAQISPVPLETNSLIVVI